jgi:hypothetical protein
MAVSKGGRNVNGNKTGSRFLPPAGEQAKIRNRPHLHLSRRRAGSFEGRGEKGEGLFRGQGLVFAQSVSCGGLTIHSGPHRTPGIREAVRGIGAATQRNPVPQETPAPVQQGLVFTRDILSVLVAALKHKARLGDDGHTRLLHQGEGRVRGQGGMLDPVTGKGTRFLKRREGKDQLSLRHAVQGNRAALPVRCRHLAHQLIKIGEPVFIQMYLNGAGGEKTLSGNAHIQSAHHLHALKKRPGSVTAGQLMDGVTRDGGGRIA